MNANNSSPSAQSHVSLRLQLYIRGKDIVFAVQVCPQWLPNLLLLDLALHCLSPYVPVSSYLLMPYLFSVCIFYASAQQEAPFLQRLSEMAEGQPQMIAWSRASGLWAVSFLPQLRAVCLQKLGRGCRKGPATHGRREALPASHRQAACAGGKQEAGSDRTRGWAQERIKGVKTEVSQRRILAFVRLLHQHCGVLGFRPGYKPGLIELYVQH